jgi:hypothetical protein
VTVSGWALDTTASGGAPIGNVVVKVDGSIVGNATYGSNRADVCVVYVGRPGCPNVGYTFALDTATLSTGAHTITVTAADTNSDLGSASVNVTVGAPLVFVDSPGPGAVVSGTVTVSGWAVDNGPGTETAISGVQVKVDGVVMGNATYGSSRADVCASFSRPGCPNVGFTFALNTAGLAPGVHTLTVTAMDSDATPLTGTWTSMFQIAAPPSVFIDAPLAGTTVSGIVTVSGWAIDNVSTAGTAISLVQVKVDGAVVGTATYGLNRADVCTALPGRPGCPNVGYTFSLNTNALSAGSHVITVSATDSDSTPDIGSASVTVTH